MKRNNQITLSLIISSIALLLILQFFWIRGVYNKASDDLKRDTNNIFRTTIFSIRDFIMVHALESLQSDSDSTILPTFKLKPDADRSSRREARQHRIGRNHVERDDDHGFEQDTVHHSRNGGPGFLFRRNFRPDSLKADTINAHFAKALATAGIDLPFHVFHLKRGERKTPGENSFISEPVRINPGARYVVMISGARQLLIRQIFPQALFSLFLTLLTIGSFYVLYQSIQRQQKLVELKNDFISNITHELKTPITTVGVALEALRNFKGLNNPELTMEYLGIAQNELGRLTILTDKILKTTFYEDKGVAFQMTRTDVRVLVNQTLNSLKLVFEKNKAQVTFQTEGDQFDVSGDADHLINVIYNLLDNAVKYSPAPASVLITLKAVADKVVLTVEDSGPGIAEEYRKKVFEKFFRIPSGDVHNVKGYGLGLSYVKTVVDGHDGIIEVLPGAQKGSRFIITLPAYKG